MIRPRSTIELNHVPLIWVDIDLYIPTLCSAIWYNSHKLTIITFKNRVDIKTLIQLPPPVHLFLIISKASVV